MELNSNYPELVEWPGKDRFKDENGNLSEEFYMAGVYYNGFALVQKEKDGPWQFRDINGNLSEEFYWAGDYYDGFALVQKKKDGPYQFRDINGNFSEKFYRAGDYYDGYAKVQKKKDGPYQFRDKNGNLSEGYYYADRYSNGFTIVQEEPDRPSQYRDILGRLTDKKTKSGEDFYKFCKGEIELEYLNEEHFLDPIFYNGVINEIKSNYLKYIDEKYAQNEAVDKALEVEQTEKIIALIDAKQKAAVEKENARLQAEAATEEKRIKE